LKKTQKETDNDNSPAKTYSEHIEVHLPFMRRPGTKLFVRWPDLSAISGITVAQQPMIYTWFPFIQYALKNKQACKERGSNLGLMIFLAI